MMQRVRQPFNVNAPAQWAALAALDDAEHVRRSLSVNRQGIDYLQKEFARLGLEFVPSHAPISFLVRVGKGQEVFNRLLSQGVIVRPMAGYQISRACAGDGGNYGGKSKNLSPLWKS